MSSRRQDRTAARMEAARFTKAVEADRRRAQQAEEARKRAAERRRQQQQRSR